MTTGVKRRTVKFAYGMIVITPHALAELSRDDIAGALNRHLTGDWGDLDEFDRNQNDYAVMYGHRILSSYRSQSRTKFWVITEADRSVTTILLPEDY